MHAANLHASSNSPAEPAHCSFYLDEPAAPSSRSHFSVVVRPKLRPSRNRGLPSAASVRKSVSPTKILHRARCVESDSYVPVRTSMKTIEGHSSRLFDFPRVSQPVVQIRFSPRKETARPMGPPLRRVVSGIRPHCKLRPQLREPESASFRSLGAGVSDTGQKIASARSFVVSAERPEHNEVTTMRRNFLEKLKRMLQHRLDFRELQRSSYRYTRLRLFRDVKMQAHEPARKEIGHDENAAKEPTAHSIMETYRRKRRGLEKRIFKLPETIKRSVY